jgi:hypothetical protein
MKKAKERKVERKKVSRPLRQFAQSGESSKLEYKRGNRKEEKRQIQLVERVLIQVSELSLSSQEILHPLINGEELLSYP